MANLPADRRGFYFKKCLTKKNLFETKNVVCICEARESLDVLLPSGQLQAKQNTVVTIQVLLSIL